MAIRQLGRSLRAPVLAVLAVLALVIVGCGGGGGGFGYLGAADRGWSPVVAAEGMVYVGTIQGQVLALEEKGGSRVEVKWAFPASEDDSIGGVYNGPVVGPNLIYVAALNGTLYALNKDTGLLEWNVVVGDASEPAALVGGPALSPDKTTVMVGSEDSNLYAYEAKTGSPRRGYPFTGAQGKIWSTPVVKDGMVYFGSHDGNVYAVDLRTGEKKWSMPTGGAVVARPLLFKDLVVVGSFDKKLYAFRKQDGNPAWGVQSIPGLQQFDGAGNWFWAGAVANDSLIFAPAMDGKVYAIDKDGKLRWYSKQLDSPIVSTPVLVHRELIVATRDGQVKRLNVESGIISGLPRLPSEVKAPLSVVPTPTPVPTPSPLRATTPTRPPFDLAIQDRSREAQSSQDDQSDSVYIGTQDGAVYRLRVTGQSLSQVWCFDTEPDQGKKLDNSKCSAAKE